VSISSRRQESPKPGRGGKPVDEEAMVGLRFQERTYDNSWIERALRKRDANYSPIVCFETNDPKRLDQLKKFFCDPRWREHSIYVYNPWDGLGQLDKNTLQVKPEMPVETKRFKEETGEQIRDLVGCLNVMDPRLKGGKVILVLYNLSREQEGRPRLFSALKAWALTPSIIAGDSTVMLMGGDVNSILDQETRDLTAVVEVDVSTEQERLDLIHYLANLWDITLGGQEHAVEAAIRGLNLHQAEAALRESYAIRHSFDLEQIKVCKGELVKKTGVLEIEEPREGFGVIGGYEPVKEFISRFMVNVIRNQDRARRFALPLPRGILFFGPPGTGKTLFAKSLAKTIEYPFINLKTESIYSPWLGQSGQQMKTAIQMAEQMSPAIVFIDEIDRFGKRGETRDSAGEETKRVFSQILEWLGDDKRKAIIVGTTNTPDALDEAFIRTGRFDYKIPLLYPDHAARLDILRLHLGVADSKGNPSPKPKPPLELPDQDFLRFLGSEIVPRTEQYTGAELEELVKRAKRSAFGRGADAVGPEDFKKTLVSFRVDPEARQRQRVKFEGFAKQFTDDETFLTDLGIAR